MEDFNCYCIIFVHAYSTLQAVNWLQCIPCLTLFRPGGSLQESPLSGDCEGGESYSEWPETSHSRAHQERKAEIFG